VISGSVVGRSVAEGSQIISMRSPWFVTAAVASVLAAAVVTRARIAPRPSEHVATFRPSRHAAPPTDFAALNAAAPRRVPESLASMMLPDDRPAVVVFLKADCGCSEEFARMLTALAPQLAARATCLAVIEGRDGEAEAFLKATGLAVPHLIQSDGRLAAAWGVTKAGCVALVCPDGMVEAIWPGISRQGFRELAGRLGDADLFPGESLSILPGPATAGCPLLSASLLSPAGGSR
jgi:hypothetical protein